MPIIDADKARFVVAKCVRCGVESMPDQARINLLIHQRHASATPPCPMLISGFQRSVLWTGLPGSLGS